MIQFAQLFNDCLTRFRGTPEYSILNHHRTGSKGLSAQDRQAIISAVECCFAPLFDQIRADASSLTDSDLVFCVLSNMGIGTTAIADCLTISPHTVRVRKYRLRDKLPAAWYDAFYGEGGAAGAADGAAGAAEGGLSGERASGGKRSRMLFVAAITICFANYFNTKGRARRKEYFSFLIFSGLFILLNTYAVKGVLFYSFDETDHLPGTLALTIMYVLSWGSILALMPPLYAVTVRRLNDMNMKASAAIWLCGVPCLLVIAIYLFDLIYCHQYFAGLDTEETFMTHLMMPWMYCRWLLLLLILTQLLTLSKRYH